MDETKAPKKGAMAQWHKKGAKNRARKGKQAAAGK
jgi:hypothetical protein